MRNLRGSAVAAWAMIAAACHRTAPVDQTQPGATISDSAVGIVQLVGAEPMTLTLAPAAGTIGAAAVLAGDASGMLRPLAGLGVTVYGSYTNAAAGGTPTPTRVFDVTRFVVRSADGVAAHDGVLAEIAGRFQLVAADGARVDVPHLPPSLRQRAGARVYLVGPLTAAPVAYGVITTP